ncbi:hypothetical protein [Halpernia sp.]|uniref:hypothetical protein n=1 Tax=Halpernia sp. TaxID=2782209 RepID=UPI003A8E1DF3
MKTILIKLKKREENIKNENLDESEIIDIKEEIENNEVGIQKKREEKNHRIFL